VQTNGGLASPAEGRPVRHGAGSHRSTGSHDSTQPSARIRTDLDLLAPVEIAGNSGAGFTGRAAGQPAGRGRGVLDAIRHSRRTNPIFFWVFALGAFLRLVTLAAYYPALEFSGDSYSYLWNSQTLVPNLWHPVVYPVFLKVLSVTHLLVAVPLAQHLLGLGTGLLLYRLIRSFGVGDLGAAVAAAPVLLDAFQIDVEHVILSEALFEFLLVLGLYLLLERRRSVGFHVLAGVLLGLATLTRTVALPCALVAVLVLIVMRAGWRRILATAGALAVPLVGYALVFQGYYGQFGWTSYTGRELYGEVAPFAKCDKLPAADQDLCPAGPLSQRAGNNQYTWSPGSLLQRLPQLPEDPVSPTATPEQQLAAATKWNIAANLRDDAAAGKFAKDVIKHQPLDYARYVASDLVHYFDPGRHTGPRDFPEVSWQFPARLGPPPPWNIDVARMGYQSDIVRPRMHHVLATALRAYQRVAYTPGPALLLGVLLGCWGALRRWRDRRAVLAAAFVLFGIGALVMPSLGAGFDYRYALPAQLFLPAAGVLGVALLRKPRPAAAASGGLVEAPPSASAAAGRRHRGLVGAGTAGAVALVMVGNAAGAQMLPADRQRPGAPAALGATQQLAGGQVAAQASNPELLHVSCGKVGHHYRIGWLVSFDVQVHLSTGPKRLVEVDDFALYGDGRDPYSRPTATKRHTVFPDAVLSAGMTRSGKIQFVVTKLDGTLLYNAEPAGGVAGWQYTLVSPAKPNDQAGAKQYTLVPSATAELPGTPCEPLPQDSPAIATTPEPWGPAQPLTTENGN
jgi:hypothetical protein